MRMRLPLLVFLLFSASLAAHVTPNVELIRKSQFVKESLAGAAQLFEKKIPAGGPAWGAMRKATGWGPSEEDAKLYVGRNAEGKLFGSVVLLWIASQHGPLCVGVVFDPAGAIRRVAVTDVASEALACVRPILDRDGTGAFVGLALDAIPNPARVAPEASGSMSRYYAKVIADAVARAQWIERFALEKTTR